MVWNANRCLVSLLQSKQLYLLIIPLQGRAGHRRLGLPKGIHHRHPSQSLCHNQCNYSLPLLSLIALALFDWRLPLYFSGVETRWGDFSRSRNNSLDSAFRLASFAFPSFIKWLYILSLTFWEYFWECRKIVRKDLADHNSRPCHWHFVKWHAV